MGLRKREYIDQETVITADNMNDIQDAVIALEDGLFSVDNNKSGEVITITDAAKRGFRSLNIFGKTTQDGTPTPDAPVDLVSVGDSGSITVSVIGENDTQRMNIATPNGLPGIPVASDGNYTDANGQQWVCDEIDFARGVYVQRCKTYIVDGNSLKVTSTNATYHLYIIDITVKTIGDRFNRLLSTHYTPTNISVDNMQPNRTIRNSYSGDKFVLIDQGLASISDANAFFAKNPMTIVSELGKPVETPLSEEELAAYADLHTYKDNTTVSNDAGAWMDLEYVMDAKKYIDSLVTGGIAQARVE